MRRYTRRAATAFVAVTVLSPVAIILLDGKSEEPAAGADRPDVVTDLERALNARAGLGGERRLSVAAFELRENQGASEISCVIRLDWEPGRRVRPVEGRGPTQADAVEDVIVNTFETFRGTGLFSA